MNLLLPLRIVVVRPPPGVAFALQSSRTDLVPPVLVSDEEIVLEATVRLHGRPDGSPNLLGPVTHGPPADRFLYVNSGTLAGQPDSRWTRRAKVKTAGITRALVDEALAAPGSVVEARIAGTTRDSGPCCGTTPLLDGGWTLREPYSPARSPRGAGPSDAIQRGKRGIRGTRAREDEGVFEGEKW
jgi:hypothetical protein